MTTKELITRPLTRFVAGPVLAVGLAVAGAWAPAAIAHAYTGSCVGPNGGGNILQVREFSLQDAGNGNSLATVEAYAAMSESDAQAYIDRPGKEEASLRLWGDDAESDQLLASFNPGRYWASAAGLGMRGSAQVSNSTLDEDPSFSREGRIGTDISPEADEFFATIRLPDFRTGATHQIETCRLSLLS